MAQDGYGVILNDIESKSEQGLAAAKRISTDTGKPVIFVAGDVSNEEPLGVGVTCRATTASDQFGFYPVLHVWSQIMALMSFLFVKLASQSVLIRILTKEDGGETRQARLSELAL